MTINVSYKRNLPHIHPADSIFFITFRLANSLPAHVLEQLHKEKEEHYYHLKKQLSPRKQSEQKYILEKLYYGKFDRLLDRPTDGPLWLKNPRIAQIVADKLQELDGKRFSILAYCIMANHVHLLIDTTGYREISSKHGDGKTKNYPLADTMRLLKGSTARFCNLALKRQGQFWHHESYDHVVRDDDELNRIIEYILNNPVKAGLVKHWQEWEFTYLRR